MLLEGSNVVPNVAKFHNITAAAESLVMHTATQRL